jgi:hypothetical protein
MTRRRLRRYLSGSFKIAGIQNLGGSEGETEDHNVVLLAVGLGYGGNLFGRLGTDLAGAVEAEELTERSWASTTPSERKVRLSAGARRNTLSAYSVSGAMSSGRPPDNEISSPFW